MIVGSVSNVRFPRPHCELRWNDEALLPNGLPRYSEQGFPFSAARLASDLRVRDRATEGANDVCNKPPTIPDEKGISANECADFADIALLVKRLLKRPHCEIHPMALSEQMHHLVRRRG